MNRSGQGERDPVSDDAVKVESSESAMYPGAP